MTPTAAALWPIVHQAQRNQVANWTWCLLRPSLVIELAEAAIRLEDAERRLAQVTKLADEGLAAWADHHRATERERLAEILDLTNLCECGKIESV